MSHPFQCRILVAVALVALFSMSQTSYAVELVNYRFESVEGDPPTGQTTPDSSGTFTTVAGSVNAVLGYGTSTPGTDFPIIATGPVQNVTANVRSLNPINYMNFPGSPTDGSITANNTRVEIADGTVGAGDATLDMAFTAFTVSMWLNPSSTSRDRFAIGKMGSAGQRGWQIYSGNGTTNLVIDYFDGPSGSDRSLTVADAFTLDTWTHLIFTFDAESASEEIYLNNVLQTPTIGGVGAPLAALNGANSAPFRVGHRGGNQQTVGAWAGGIDDVRIFDSALEFSEIGSAEGTGSLLKVIPLPQFGDYNEDGTVDAADYVLWRKNVDGETAFPNDNDLGTPIGQAHYDLWAANFGLPEASAAGLTSVVAPEPTSVWLALAAAVALVGYRRRRRG
ncbi:MAG: LamG domain-containing protein [Pirellulales bacterium]